MPFLGLYQLKVTPIACMPLVCNWHLRSIIHEMPKVVIAFIKIVKSVLVCKAEEVCTLMFFSSDNPKYKLKYAFLVCMEGRALRNLLNMLVKKYSRSKKFQPCRLIHCNHIEKTDIKMRN